MMKKILFIIAALPLFFTYSCYKNQDDTFSKDAVARIDQWNAETKAILEASENGWIFDYWPGKERQYGGYIYLVSFEGQQVTAAFELNRSKLETSIYEYRREIGPSISFSTFNPFLHIFAKPSQSASLYQGRHGDYEFAIIEKESNLVTLRGKEYTNIMTLTKMPIDKTWDQYLDEVNDLYTNLRPIKNYKLLINGEEVATVVRQNDDTSTQYVDESRKFVVTYPNPDYVEGETAENLSVTVPFVILNDGIKFYNTLEFNEISMRTFLWDSSNKTFVCTDSKAEVEIVAE